MMNIEIQSANKMSQSGQGILRALQNQTLPDLDLLVREVIQNSLDAAKTSSKYVNVDFSMGDFDETSIEEILEAFNVEKISKRFDKKFIVITDTNTNGLTGPLQHEDIGEDQKYGNLIRLVYDLAKPQEQEGAGGSWGYGKSIYYRLGAGLVFYYTKIMQDGVEAERLVAAFIENEKGETILPPAPGTTVKTGIAWWGEKVGKNKTIPVTSSKKIEEVLGIFGIDPFGKNVTGTKIIIPYIDENNLLKRAFGFSEERKANTFYDDILDYIVTSVQRWYAPRLYNEKYAFNDGKYLRVTINGSWEYELEPIFQVIQDMYNYAVSKDNKIISHENYKDANIGLESIQYYKTRDYFKSPYLLGTLVHGKFKYDSLGMQNPNSINYPHFLVGLTRDSDNESQDFTNRPLVTFTRQPGMLINYEDKSTWTNGIPTTGLEEYIIAIFVLESNADVYGETLFYAKLDEYVRQGEKADHTSWSDPIMPPNNNQYDLVKVLQQRVNNSLKNRYEKKVDESIGRSKVASLLSKKFTEKLLPSEGYGSKASRGKSKRPRVSGQIYASPKHRARLLSEDIIYESNRITIPFQVDKIKQFDEIQLELKLHGTKDYPIPSLEEDLKKKASLFIESIHIEGLSNDIDYTMSALGTIYKATVSTVGYEQENKFNGEIVINTIDSRIVPVVTINVKADDYE